MKQFWVIAAAALLFTALLPEGASAQRGGFRGGGGFGGGFRGAAIGGGFRGGAIGGGFRAAPLGGGFRAAPIGGFRGAGLGVGRIGPSFRTAAIGGGFRGPGLGVARVAPGFRGAAFGRGFRVAGFRGPGWGWRRGWGVPLAVGFGLGAYPYYSSYYSDPCIAWDGYEWVDICGPYY
jgi:hypothetical protein